MIPPPEYEEDDSPDYALAPGDEAEAESSETEEANKLLGSLNIRSYDTVDATLAYSKLSATQRRNYLEKRVLPEAIYRRNQLKGYKSSFTKKMAERGNNGRAKELATSKNRSFIPSSE